MGFWYKLVCLLISLSALSVNADNLDDVRAAIDAQNASYMSLYKQADASGLAALHSEDVVLLTPNREKIEGREAVLQSLIDDFSIGPAIIELHTESLEMAGERVLEIGEYRIQISPEGLQPISDRGSYIVVWKQESSGNWLMHRDIWNSNLPLE